MKFLHEILHDRAVALMELSNAIHAESRTVEAEGADVTVEAEDLDLDVRAVLHADLTVDLYRQLWTKPGWRHVERAKWDWQAEDRHGEQRPQISGNREIDDEEASVLSRLLRKQIGF